MTGFLNDIILCFTRAQPAPKRLQIKVDRKKIGLGNGRYDKGTCRKRRTAVAKVDAAEDCTAEQHWTAAHDIANRHADDPHRRSRAKRSADEHRQHAVQQKSQQQKCIGADKLSRLVDKERNCTAGPPGHSNQSDETKDNEHHADGLYPLP